MRERGETRTKPDAPEGEDLGPDFWEKAELKWPDKRRSVHLRLDADVFDYFASGGKGHLSRMQNVLRSYVEAKRASEPQDG